MTETETEIPTVRSGSEAQAVLAVASEHFDGVRCPRTDRWALIAATRELERASLIAADPGRYGRRDLDGCVAVLDAARRVTARRLPFGKTNAEFAAMGAELR